MILVAATGVDLLGTALRTAPGHRAAGVCTTADLVAGHGVPCVVREMCVESGRPITRN